MNSLDRSKWIICPVCGNKTRDKIRADTVMEHYPLFCPKCKHETLINGSGRISFAKRQRDMVCRCLVE